MRALACRTLLPLALLLGALPLLSPGCTAPAEVAASDSGAELILAQQAEQVLHRFALEAPVRAVRWAESQAGAPSMATALADAATWEDDPDILAVLRAAWEARGADPWLTRPGGPLSPEGDAVLATLRATPDHGLHPDLVHLDTLEATLEALTSGLDPAELLGAFALEPDEQAAVQVWLRQHVGLDDSLPSAEALWTAVESSAPGQPLPRWRQAMDTLVESLEARSAQVPALEVQLTAALLRYGRAQRWANLQSIPRAERQERGWNIEEVGQQSEIVRTRMAEGLAAAMAASDLDAWLADLKPPGEQYARLLEGARMYRGFVEAGGWPELSLPANFGSGASGPDVAALRDRLRREGYYTATATDDRWDSALTEAVRWYQETHQMEVSGRVTEEMLQSLNLPADRRLAQIHVAMDRWRQARSTRDVGGEYIWVNVPDFHAELWDSGERVHRWRVITGRPRNTRDRRGNPVIAGRTPLFSDTLRYVVFNPYWNVPRDIRREEYQHLIDGDPNWLADNGFEIIQGRDGEEILRQLPGPSNALGQVKFIFPNEHDVYMHDTPNRRLFDRITRAMSHGCVRVDRPLDLARLIMQRDRSWSATQAADYVDRQLDTGTEQWVTLLRPIPIHIEYYSVRGADDGRMHFLADPYRYDRDDVTARQEALATLLSRR
jgi:murein L,D-transpeptidase YcbB/YkuD